MKKILLSLLTTIVCFTLQAKNVTGGFGIDFDKPFDLYISISDQKNPKGDHLHTVKAPTPQAPFTEYKALVSAQDNTVKKITATANFKTLEDCFAAGTPIAQKIANTYKVQGISADNEKRQGFVFTVGKKLVVITCEKDPKNIQLTQVFVSP